MKKLIALAFAATVVLGGFADDESVAWQKIYWMVEDQSSTIPAYDNAKLYAQLGEGETITLSSLKSSDYVKPGEDSEPAFSPNLLTTLGADLTGYSFWAELYNDSAAVGQTAVLSYQGMLDANAISSWGGGSGIPAYNLWAPTFSAVPEPTSGLLVLLGVAGLALRRRRQVV